MCRLRDRAFRFRAIQGGCSFIGACWPGGWPRAAATVQEDETVARSLSRMVPCAVRLVPKRNHLLGLLLVRGARFVEPDLFGSGFRLGLLLCAHRGCLGNSGLHSVPKLKVLHPESSPANGKCENDVGTGGATGLPARFAPRLCLRVVPCAVCRLCWRYSWFSGHLCRAQNDSCRDTRTQPRRASR